MSTIQNKDAEAIDTIDNVQTKTLDKERKMMIVSLMGWAGYTEFLRNVKTMGPRLPIRGRQRNEQKSNDVAEITFPLSRGSATLEPGKRANLVHKGDVRQN